MEQGEPLAAPVTFWRGSRSTDGSYIELAYVLVDGEELRAKDGQCGAYHGPRHSIVRARRRPPGRPH